MSDKNFTIYVTGGTNVFVPVLSDDPKQVSRVLDSLKRCYGDDDSEEIQAAISFVSDYLDDLIPESEKKFSGGNNRKETRNGVLMSVVPGKEPQLMAEYNHRKVLTLGEEKYLVGDAALYGYDSKKHEVYIDPDMVEDLLNDIEERTVMLSTGSEDFPAIRI